MPDLWIPGPLPGLNELLAAAKSGRGRGNAYSRLKAEWTDIIWAHVKSARWHTIQIPAVIYFHWVERNRKRDPDNVAAGGRKLILDALVKAGSLPGDGWDYVKGWHDSFSVGACAGVWLRAA